MALSHWLALDSGFLRPPSVSAARAGQATFRGGRDCHPTGRRAPRGRLVSGLEKLVSTLHPPTRSLELEERVSAGTGIWRFPTFHRGWGGRESWRREGRGSRGEEEVGWEPAVQ